MHRTMRLLAFDTSTERLSIALQTSAHAQPWLYEGAAGAHSSSSLIPKILEGMQALDLRWSDLEAIVFGQGPGAFTGLRTSCAVAQGLGFGANLPVVPVVSLLSVAEQAGADKEFIYVALDARMGEVYHSLYQRRHSDGAWESVREIGLCPPQDVEVPSGVAVIGNAGGVYPNLAPEAEHIFALPSALTLLRIAPRLIAQGAACRAQDALPLYVRDKVAQTSAERERQLLKC